MNKWPTIIMPGNISGGHTILFPGHNIGFPFDLLDFALDVHTSMAEMH